MKPAIIAAVVLAATIYFPPRSEAQQRSSDVQQPAQNKSHLNGQPPANHKNGEHPAAETQTTKKEPPNWYKSPEWALVIVGIITCFVIGCQAVQTRLAAQASKISADAAKASADALINSERAWVIAGIKRYQKTATAFSLSITNHGRTPARIIWYEREFSLIPISGTRLSDATSREKSRVNRQVFLAVGKPRRLEVFDLPTLLGMKIWDDIRAEKTILVCSGQIQYLDVVSGRCRDTWFCYSYSVSRHVFSADGRPPEENRYT